MWFSSFSILCFVLLISFLIVCLINSPSFYKDKTTLFFKNKAEAFSEKLFRHQCKICLMQIMYLNQGTVCIFDQVIVLYCFMLTYVDLGMFTPILYNYFMTLLIHWTVRISFIFSCAVHTTLPKSKKHLNRTKFVRCIFRFKFFAFQ